MIEKRSGKKSGVSRRDFIKAGAAGVCGICMAGLHVIPERAEARTSRQGFMKPRKSPWFSPLAKRHVICGLCPKECRIAPGERGACRVRENRGGVGYTLAWGNPCLVQLDPVERIPFFHLVPGSRTLSVSTAGCPLECRFCEVWDMALSSPEEVHSYDLPPDEIIRHALSAKARSVSYAFGEPVAFYEYMVEIATEAKRAGLLNLMHSSGYISPAPLEALTEVLDAVNIDLKSYDPGFYRDMTGGELKPVLETAKRIKRAGIHMEITNLVIPTLNDDMERIRETAMWIRDELGPEVPLHFSRFYPLYKLANLPPTPVSTLDRARNTALEAGLDFAYVARVTGHAGENTFCPGCGEKVIERLGFVIEHIRMENGACAGCGTPIPGRWE